MNKTPCLWLIALALVWAAPPVYGIEGILRFDFEPAHCMAADGYIHVDETTAYDPLVGYGIYTHPGHEDAPIWSRNRSCGANELLRDFVAMGQYRDFRVDLPNGDYYITIAMGDPNHTECAGINLEEDRIVYGLTADYLVKPAGAPLRILEHAPGQQDVEMIDVPRNSNRYADGMVRILGYHALFPDEDDKGIEYLLLDHDLITITDGQLVVANCWDSGNVVNYIHIIPATCAALIEAGYTHDCDINGDCFVDLRDVGFLTEQWMAGNDSQDDSNEPSSFWPADVNDDGQVGLPDLSAVIHHWLLHFDPAPQQCRLHRVLLDHENQPMQVVLVRDKFGTHQYSVYVPADEDGIYWTKWQLQWPTLYKHLYPIGSVIYGKVYEGKWQDCSEATAVGTWTEHHDGSATIADPLVVYRNDGTPGDYLEWNIPDGHNRIHAYIGNIRLLAVSLVNGIGLNLAAIGGVDDMWHFQDYVVATNAIGTDRKLRLTIPATPNGARYVVGIKSYNTSVIGHPATATGGIADGHDVITIVRGSDDVSGLTAVGNLSWEVMYNNTCEATIAWKPVAESQYKWTAPGAHYRAVDASFSLSSSPMLHISGSPVGDMTDTAVAPLGKVFRADTILQQINGYGVWDESHHELNLRTDLTFSQAGVGISASVNLTGDIDIQSAYIPSIPIPRHLHGWVQPLPNKPPAAIGSNYTFVDSSRVSITPSQQPFVICAQSAGPVASLFENASLASSKLYFDLDVTAFGTTSGSEWTAGAFICVEPSLVYESAP